MSSCCEVPGVSSVVQAAPPGPLTPLDAEIQALTTGSLSGGRRVISCSAVRSPLFIRNLLLDGIGQ